MSKIKQLQTGITSKGGFILSDGTCNLNHLLPKAYDLIVGAELSESLAKDILNVFYIKPEDKEMIGIYGLFNAQYNDFCKIPEDKEIEASEIWNESIYNLFNNIAPYGYYFGSSEGDGACFGWFQFESDSF